eukprot:3652059-Prymnesium_polylepis.1
MELLDIFTGAGTLIVKAVMLGKEMFAVTIVLFSIIYGLLAMIHQHISQRHHKMHRDSDSSGAGQRCGRKHTWGTFWAFGKQHFRSNDPFAFLCCCCSSRACHRHRMKVHITTPAGNSPDHMSFATVCSGGPVLEEEPQCAATPSRQHATRDMRLSPKQLHAST